MEADGTVAVQVHAHLILRRPTALLNDEGIRAGNALTQVDMSE